jgi:hypothetical protein
MRIFGSKGKQVTYVLSSKCDNTFRNHVKHQANYSSVYFILDVFRYDADR